MWHRLPDFQLIALKAIAKQILRHSPEYSGKEMQPVYIPGELLRENLHPPSPVLLYTSQSNPGVAELAEELVAMYPTIVFTDDVGLLPSSPEAMRSLVVIRFDSGKQHRYKKTSLLLSSSAVLLTTGY